MRIVRRLAAVLALAVPLGAVVAANGASANSTENPTLTLYSAPTLTTPTIPPDENFTGTYTTSVVGTTQNENVSPFTGSPVVGNYPFGQVFVAAYNVTTFAITTICTSPDYTTGTPSADITLVSPDEVDYTCTSGTQASLLPAGTYDIYSYFVPDHGIDGSSALTGVSNTQESSATEQQIVVDAFNTTPGVTTTLSGTAAGSTVTDQADITTGTPGTNGPTYPATVTFTVWSGVGCGSGSVISTDSEPVGEDSGLGNTNDGDATSQNIVVPSTTGTSVYVFASYSGNTFNAAADAACETLTASPASPGISTTASNLVTPDTVGSPVTDLVNVTGLSGTNATGDIVLSIHQGANCTGALLNSYVYPLPGNITGTSASFTASYTPTAIGPDSWSSSYAGDVNNTATNGPCEGPVLINAVPTPPAPPTPTNGPLSITTHFLPGGMHGRSYAEYVVAHGGTPPLTWSISAGALPAGLHINSATGLISGTLGAVGTYHFTVKVTDSTAAPTGPLTASQAYTVTIT